MARDIHAQSIPLPKFPMSAFDLSNNLKYCTSAGKMNCHYVEECIPGDIAHIKTDLFIRLDPLTFPILHRVKVRQNFFFVADRLILGDDMTEEFFSCNDLKAKLPQVRFSGLPLESGAANVIQAGSLFDQMGCQPVVPDGNSTYVVRNPLPFYMVNKIWMDWYADEIYDAADIANLETSIKQYRAAGLNSYVQDDYYPFFYRLVSYSKDRFTCAQPDAQRVGEVYVMNPLSLIDTSGNIPAGTGGTALYVGEASSSHPGSVIDGSSNQYRSTLTIDELWDEMVVQRFLNSLNEFGNERYVEILAGQFGVLSQDQRFQRSQWLGGNEMVVNIAEVLQTSESTSGNPLGSFAGKGLLAGRGRDIAFKVPEHGFIIGIQTIVPENGYASGSPRWLYKESPLDFAMPRFNNLGESAVYKGELCSDHLLTGSLDMEEQAYQPQFDEYRSHPSRSTMDFRDSSFLAWHLDRKFTTPPAQNANFIHVSPTETNRIFNDTDSEANHYKVLAFTKSMFVRPISRHPIPGKL